MNSFSKYGIAAAFAFSLGLASPAWAEDIVYDQTAAAAGAGLQPSPAWVPWIGNSLFPGTTAEPSASGNSVSVDYDPLSGTPTNPANVFGGLVETGDAANNTVDLVNGAVTDYVMGGYSARGNTTGNTVDISGGTIGDGVYGGYSARGNTTGNAVTVSGGTIEWNIFGGSTNEGDATDNTVTISGGTINDPVYGGYSTKGDAIGNTLTVSGGTFNDTLNGGRTANGDATGNTVNVSGVIVTHVYGGQSTINGSVTGNTVTLGVGASAGGVYGGVNLSGNAAGNTASIGVGASAGSVYGGQSSLGEATGNTANISGTVFGATFGGFSANGNATGNTVNIADGTLQGPVYGGQGNYNMVSGNTVNMTGGTIGTSVSPVLVYGGINSMGKSVANTVSLAGGVINATVLGGASATSDATGNSVIVSGGEINGTGGNYVAGGESGGSDALNNSVSISGGTVGIDVYGGRSAGGNATGNTVTLSGAPDLSAATLYGGFAVVNRDPFTGNTLNVNGFQGAIEGANNFEFYNFTLPAGLANGGVVLTSTNPVDLAGAQTAIVGMGPGNALNPGDTITLIDNTVNEPLATSGLNVQNYLLTYQFSLLADNGALLASLGGIQTTPSAKALVEGRAAGLGFLSQGADLVAGAGMDSLLAQTRQGGLGAFGAMAGGWNRYQTGSHVDVSGFSLLAGLGWRAAQPAIAVGAFFEAGWGNYDSYNSFANLPSVKGNGNPSYYGGGLLGRFDFLPSQRGNAYAEASLRMGQSDNDFSSADLGYGWGASYDSSVTYYGAHAGLGYLWKLGEKPLLDTYLKYLWTHQDSDNMTVLGEPVRFDAADSHRLRAGARLSYKVTEIVTPYVGAAFEYEFDGGAGGNVRGYTIDEADLSGATGMGELGLSVQPASALPLYLDLGVQGYVGQRQGVNGSLQIKWRF